MSDPLTDPRAKDLLSADPNEVASLSTQFRNVATDVETAIHGLQGAHNAADWTGPAADLFRQKLGRLPGDLQKVQQSYGDAATTLSAYATHLGPLKSQFQALVPQIQGAQTAVTTAQGNVNAAKGNLTTAQNAKAAKPTDPSVTSAKSAVNTAGGALTRAQGDLSSLDGRANHILDEFETLRGQARSAIAKAAGLAPQHHSSWFSSLCSAVGDFVKGAAKFIADAAVNVWHAAERLPGDFVHLVTHLGDLKAWSKFLGDLGTVAGAVALVAAVIVCPLDAAGFEAVAAGLSTFGEAAGTAATYMAIAKTGTDTGLVLEGKGTWGQVGFDAISVAAGQTKIPGLKGAKGTASDLEGQATALETYAAGRESGLTASQAYSALTDGQKTLLRDSTVSLTANRGLTTLISTTKGLASAASTVEHRFIAGNEFAHAFGTDPALEKYVKPLLAPEGGDGGGGEPQPAGAAG